MMKPSDAQRIVDEDDYSYMPRDVLEFNYRQVARGFVAWAEAVERHRAEDIARLRDLIDVGQHVAVLLAKAQRAGRKTVRIDQLLDEAQKRADEGRQK